MGTGYTRNDTSNNIADGNVIDAADLDGEFDAIQSAFNASTGHTHDGTTAEGAPIEVTGPAQEYVSTATEFRPKTNNTYDLGSAALQWKDLYVDGTANIDSLVADTADINAGTVDNAVIGGATPAAGTFTTATATTGNITTVNATTVDTTNAEVTNIKAKDGTASATIANSTGVMTIASSVLTTTDINGGTIDGTTIGGASAAAGTFTTVTASGDLTIADKIVHSGDTNTSIRFPAADTVTVETGGAERMRIDSSGNVGIGTSSPSVKLDISGGNVKITNASNSKLEFRTSGNNSTSELLLEATTSTGTTDQTVSIKAVGSGSTELGANLTLATKDRFGVQSERMRIDSSGNVGIGTSSPSRTLSVVDATNDGSGGILVQNYLPAIELDDASAGGTSTIIKHDGTATIIENGGSERLRIDSSGNVGIGTSSPTASLDIPTGGIRVNSSGSDTNSKIGNFGVSGYEGYIEPYDSNAFTNIVNTVSAKGITFQTGGTERMRLDSSGNLLVGTTSNLGGLGGRLQVESGGGRGIVQNLTSGVQRYSEFLYAGSTVGFISTNGSSTTYSTSSDYRLKEDVQPMTGASDRVLALNPVNFAWKSDGSRTDGFIAHEAQEIAPYAVTGEKDGEEMQAMDHSKLVPLLTAALQEALERIAVLEEKCKA